MFGEAAARLAGLAARLLGWRPSEFWTATPAELEAALRGGEDGGGEGPSRDDMAALMALHPDAGDMGDGR